jgi:hypothetical protein
MRADGEGPFPASWPTYAVVCQNYEQERGHGSSNATLFLASGPDLPQGETADGILPYADLAAPCLVGPKGSYAGVWASMKRDGEMSFVFADWAGGIIGLRVRIFDQDPIEYGGPAFGGDYQVHSFHAALDDGSRLPVYVGDTDGDGFDELLIASTESNDSGAPGTPERWRVIKWEGGRYAVIKIVGRGFVDAHPSLRELGG